MTDQTVRPHKSTTHQELFYHIKSSDLEKRVSTSSPLSWSFLRFQAFTVFAREEEGQWYAALAYCVTEDVFNRKRGRNTARKNFFQGNKGKVMIATGDREGKAYPTHHDAELFVMDMLTSPDNIPSREVIRSM